MNKIKLSVTWDEGTDNLPTEFEVFITNEDMIEDIIDELSDNYGFAISSSEYETVEENADPFISFFTKHNPAEKMIVFGDNVVKAYIGNGKIKLTGNQSIELKPSWCQIVKDKKLVVQTEDNLAVFEAWNIKW